jgi:nicotinate phosphoribosyltransferase
MYPIIIAIDDQDVYKKYMQAFLLEKGLGENIAEYKLFNRGKTKFTSNFKSLLSEQIEYMSYLKWSQQQLGHLKKKASFLSDDYIYNFLPTTGFNPESVTVDQQGSEVEVTVKDKMKYAIDWEVPLMAVISELNNMSKGLVPLSFKQRQKRNIAKFKALEALGSPISEFGTRRRAFRQIQYESLFYMKKFMPTGLIGTSNIQFGRTLDLPLTGTIAHELYMLYAVLYGVEKANALLTKHWREVFGENISIVLPDTFTTPYFLKTFSKEDAELTKGSRQDSMDPKQYTDLFVDFYKSFGIDPKTKKIIYSDSIDSVEKITGIDNYAKQFVQPGYGIGTWITNDCDTEKMNMVIKLTAVWLNDIKNLTAKLSDVNGKITGDKETANNYLNLIEK